MDVESNARASVPAILDTATFSSRVLTIHHEFISPVQLQPTTKANIHSHSSLSQLSPKNGLGVVNKHTLRAGDDTTNHCAIESNVGQHRASDTTSLERNGNLIGIGDSAAPTNVSTSTGAKLVLPPYIVEQKMIGWSVVSSKRASVAVRI
jgi:hypothetical protein